jgi:hypothetical protein
MLLVGLVAAMGYLLDQELVAAHAQSAKSTLHASAFVVRRSRVRQTRGI